ncbi:hypothetical protein Tco_0915599 [Tanacetum coccineum]
MPSFPSPEPTVSYFNDLDFFKYFENEFPAIVYNDALTSKLKFLTKPTVSPQHIDEFDLKDETSLSECDEEEQNVLKAIQHMAPLPPREQRYSFLRYQGLEYSDQDIADFNRRLERIYDRGTHRVQIWRGVCLHLDAPGNITILVRRIMRRLSWTEFILAPGLHTGEEIESLIFARYWSESERMITEKGDLRDYWRDISTDGDFLGPPPSYTLIRDPVLRLFHRMMAENLVEKFIQKFYQLSDDHEEIETDEDDDPDDIAKIFKIEDNLFNYETPLWELEEPWSKNGVSYQLCDHICEPCRFKNGKTKWPTCSSDIDGFYNGGELPRMVRVGCMTYFQDHKWYDELTDGRLKEEALMHNAKIEESWGDATPGVMKFCEWLKKSFENFYELDYDVLVKLEECWEKVNAHENASFARWENYDQGPYANTKTKKDYDPYLENNRIFGKNYKANNTGDTQDTKKEHRDPLTCYIRRFKMVKYSFKDDKEYVAIKENEYDDLTNTSKEAIHAYQEIFRMMDEEWMDLAAKKLTKLVKYRSSGILCVIVVMLEYKRIYNTHPFS